MAKDAKWYLDKNKKYFLREFIHVQKLLAEEHVIARSIHNFSKNNENKALLTLINAELDKLQRRQRWQQFRARYPKLRKALGDILKQRILSVRIKRNVLDLMEKFEVFEADLLRNTKAELEPLLKKKEPTAIDWKKVIKITEKLKVDLQALTLLVQQLKAAIEKK